MGNSKPGTEMHNFTNPPAKRVADFESGKSYMATTHTNEDLSTLSKPLKCWGRKIRNHWETESPEATTPDFRIPFVA